MTNATMYWYTKTAKFLFNTFFFKNLKQKSKLTRQEGKRNKLTRQEGKRMLGEQKSKLTLFKKQRQQNSLNRTNYSTTWFYYLYIYPEILNKIQKKG